MKKTEKLIENTIFNIMHYYSTRVKNFTAKEFTEGEMANDVNLSFARETLAALLTQPTLHIQRQDLHHYVNRLKAQEIRTDTAQLKRGWKSPYNYMTSMYVEQDNGKGAELLFISCNLGRLFDHNSIIFSHFTYPVFLLEHALKIGLDELAIGMATRVTFNDIDNGDFTVAGTELVASHEVAEKFAKSPTLKVEEFGESFSSLLAYLVYATADKRTAVTLKNHKGLEKLLGEEGLKYRPHLKAIAGGPISSHIQYANLTLPIPDSVVH